MTPETIRECERMSYFAGEWKPEVPAAPAKPADDSGYQLKYTA